MQLSDEARYELMEKIAGHRFNSADALMSMAKRKGRSALSTGAGYAKGAGWTAQHLARVGGRAALGKASAAGKWAGGQVSDIGDLRKAGGLVRRHGTKMTKLQKQAFGSYARSGGKAAGKAAAVAAGSFGLYKGAKALRARRKAKKQQQQEGFYLDNNTRAALEEAILSQLLELE